MSTSKYTPIFKKLLAREDLDWFETSPRSLPRFRGDCNGTSHMYYTLSDGLMIKISERVWEPSNYQIKKPGSAVKGFKEIAFFLEDTKRRFGRRSCSDLLFGSSDCDWNLLNILLEKIQNQESTQLESSLIVPPEDLMLKRIAKIL